MMLSLITILLASHATNIEWTVRDERSTYNVAISARNLPAIEHLLAPGYVVLPGLTGTPLSREGLLSLFAKDFRDPSFITYTRVPERFQRSRSSKRIAETGHWIGSWKKSDGQMTETGIYQAFWARQGDGWKLINESFVTLQCAGSRECRSDD
jgi:hypothetical protein